MFAPDRPDPLYLALVLALAAGIAAWGLAAPVNNWDLIGYIASALSQSGLSGEALHRETYAELARAIPPDRFDLLTTNGRYARGVYADPQALEQQLPFYRIRVAYVVLLQAMAQLTHSLALATYAVSAVSAAGLVALSGLLLRDAAPGLNRLAAAALLAAILHVSSVPLLAQLSTPDALYSLLALAVLALFYHARLAALGLTALLVLIRTDAIVLNALLGLLMLIERDRNLRHYAALAASVLLYFWVNGAFGGYSHAVLFNFSFLPGQRSPYPESLMILTDPGAYLDVYRQRAAGMLGRWVPWVLLAGLGAVALAHWRAGRLGPRARLTLVAVAYVLLHFLAFPLGAARHYGFALVWCGIQVVSALPLTRFPSRA